LALRGDGEVVEIGYRADPFDKVFTAASFLQRAHIAPDPNYGSRWADFADEIYEGVNRQEHNDSFFRGDQRRPWMEIPDAEGHDFFYRFANRDKPVRKTGYVFNNEDKPLQDVMDSKFNEVALDYGVRCPARRLYRRRAVGSAVPK